MEHDPGYFGCHTVWHGRMHWPYDRLVGVVEQEMSPTQQIYLDRKVELVFHEHVTEIVQGIDTTLQYYRHWSQEEKDYYKKEALKRVEKLEEILEDLHVPGRYSRVGTVGTEG